LNGTKVIAVAFVLPMLDFSEKAANGLGWVIVADGWSNVGFYCFGNFTPNRGLSFGDNRFVREISSARWRPGQRTDSACSP
jgi:styrene-oxide isomerase